MQNKIAHIFPAFVLKYTGKELSLLKKHNYDFYYFLKKCEEVLNVDLCDFEITENNFIDNEFKNQVFSYAFSCAFSDVLNEQKQIPDYISGFSMGIYSALYHTKAIDFEVGLLLIIEVFEQIKNIIGNKHYVMASVIGFEEYDLKSMINGFDSVEVVIQNGIYSFVISGIAIEVEKLMVELKQEGAIHLSLFKVNFAYHSILLRNHVQEFQSIASKYKIETPQVPLISMINQEKLVTPDQLKYEISNNVTLPLNFLKTIEILKQLGVNEFIEVGADSSLLKSSKFIDGDFSFKAVAKGKVL